MMISNRLLLSAVFGVGGYLSLPAQNTMVITMHNETTTSYRLTDVSALRFQASELLIAPTNRNEASSQLQLSDIQSIKFTQSDPTSISLPQTDSQPAWRLQGNMLTVELPSASHATLSVYSVSGKCMLNIPSYTGQAISIAPLPKGLYIAKIANKTFKFFKA